LTHEEARFTGAGGLEIYCQSWLPEIEPRAAVVIVHGAGEHSGRYPHVAARLVADGYAVHALDHRGHGRSQGARALLDRMDNAVADLDSLVLRVAERHPGLQIFMLAHSMGGTVGLCYAMRHQDRLAGLILSAPLAALEAASPVMRITGKLLSTLAPRLGLIAVDSSLISRDPEVVSAYEADALVHHGKLPARTVAELAVAIESFPDAVGAIEIPTLILYGTADGLCPPSGSVMVGERVGSSDLTVKSYDGLYHEILNEPEQGVVLDDLCSWLNDRVGAAAVGGAAGSTTS
jgi:acylglycerol lipase